MAKVFKRDGREVDFDVNRPIVAMTRAYKATYNDDPDEDFRNLSDTITESIRKTSEKKDLSVEDIQNSIESKLMASKYKDVAKNYIIYRENRTVERNKRSQFSKIIGEKLMATNVQNQNANVDEHSFGGRRGEAASELSRQYALDNIISDMAKNNHRNNEIYIHDLDSYALGNHNCLTVPFDDLLADGFNTRQMDIRPAGSINSAFQLVAVIFQLQSLQQFGGVSASHIDWTMVPYVRKSFFKHFKNAIKYLGNSVDESDIDNGYITKRTPINADIYKLDCYKKEYQYALDMTEKETRQAVEGMYHNLNTLQSRSGNQLPFTSINYGTCTLPEGRMVTKAILEESIKGGGKLHKTYIFPCGIFQCMKGVNRKPGDPNYDLFKLAIKSTAQRLYPNYVNVDWSVNAGYDINDPKTYVSTMGCRTYNGFDMNGFGQLKDGRGNICPVTIIMPTLAMESDGEVGNKNVEDFINILDRKIHEAKDMLIERYQYICSQNPLSATFMWENGLMKGYKPEEGIRSAMKHGTLALGQIGLAETLRILIGKDQTTDEGMALAKRIEQLFKDRCAEFKHEEHTDPDGYKYYLNFGVYYSPAENLCYTSMKKFQKKYGKIKGISDRDYFTNSIHCSVWEHMSPFEKINIESQLTGYSSAGCITYVELDDGAKNNLDAVEQIVNYAMDHDIPYFSINVPNDTCLDCGYTDEINDACPICGSKNIQRLRRVTGYLTGNYTTAFNKGKQAEVRDRVKHSDYLKGWK